MCMSLCLFRRRETNYHYIYPKQFGFVPRRMTGLLYTNVITSLFAYCKGGNFNIHIWVRFGYSSAKEGKSGFIYNLVKS